ncbi:AAA family ATPase [Intestinibacter sp.]|uniref:AAA family ATPase n=1 Tax=Intestinibacter sp. TaxID=1965304 RepID=UPI002A762010|nr:AAA family ATPase [Intestinibacter sp.]MDY2735516.1 AAA family ATPase [Intestinibacter sp.]
MNDIIRLKNIYLENFKNVDKGKLGFSENNKKNGFSDILGIYGQNGSGKTAVIEALDLFKAVLSGRSISPNTKYLIGNKKEYCKLGFEFLLKNNNDNELYKVFYDFEIKTRKKIDEEFVSDYLNDDISEKDEEVILVNKESLSFSYKSESGKWSKIHIMDYNIENQEYIFTPKGRYDEIAKNIDTKIQIDVAKSMSQENSTSFIFSNKMIKVLKDNLEDKMFNIVQNLKYYSMFNLFVINNRQLSMANSNIAMPFNFRIEDGNKITGGSILINLFETSELEEERYLVIEKIINQINIVISSIIPNLEILLKSSKFKGKKGNDMIEIKLFSKRGDREIPLKYESDGIKKIICILSALIAMYNNERILVAIDELDAGIFEYLLGEILAILGNEAKGQLIFTSHNLRALETLNKDLVVFTTTNPENRYISLTNVKPTNNLRDVYYRGIVLGGQKEELYDETNKYEISYSFRKAWKK